MPDETIDQTPQNGTGDQTPGGTEDQTAAVPASDASPTINYEEKFKQSQAEGIRLFQENQRLQAMLSNAAQPPKVEPQENFTFADAVLDREDGKIQNFFGKLKNEIIGEVTSRTAEEQAKQARMQASFNVYKDAFIDPKNPIGASTMQHYQQMAFDPYYNSIVAQDYVEIPSPQGPIKINPHIMRFAYEKAEKEVGSKLTKAKENAIKQESFIESAQSGPKATATKFAPTKHLTELERATCEKRGWDMENYFNHMDVKIKEARLKAGKPLTRREIGL